MTDNIELTHTETDKTDLKVGKTDDVSRDEIKMTECDENKSELTCAEFDKSFANVSFDSISETETTENESKETDKTETTWQQIAKSCSIFVDEYLDFFKCARTYNLHHVDNNAGVISRALGIRCS